MTTHLFGGRDWPDLDLDAPCCLGSAVHGPQACTCWQPVYDLDQGPLDTSAQPGTQPAMCADCAYRPGSPERAEDPHANVQGLDELHHLAATGRPFYCHQGMRLVRAWHHPSGAVISGETGEYDPPIRAGVPYQADGTPGLVCGGWAAVRRRHDTEPPTGETLRDGSPARGCGRAGAHGPEGGSLSPRAAERAGDRTSRVVAVASHPEHAGGDP